jgi:hypothetical protein
METQVKNFTFHFVAFNSYFWSFSLENWKVKQHGLIICSSNFEELICMKSSDLNAWLE